MAALTKDKVIIYIYIAGALVGVFFIYKVMAKLGLVKTSEDKKEDKNVTALQTCDYFDPTIINGRSFTILGETKAKSYAGEIYKALHGSLFFGLGTDEEAIYSIFGRFNNKYQIAEVAGWYQIEFNVSLLTDLLNELSDSEKSKLYSIIDKLS
jgi:hypothetical protein